MSTIPIRHLESADYERIAPQVDAWWGGRAVSGLLPRLFFEHFSPMSFLAEENGEAMGFLVGFQSQTSPAVAYIHFVGVSPAARLQGLGRRMYERFFAAAKALGCLEAHAITSPVNQQSILFHQKMGFQVIEGDGVANGTPVFLNYAGPNQARVLFRRPI